MKVLLTGASGFLGKAILMAGEVGGFSMRPVFRRMELVRNFNLNDKDSIFMPTIEWESDWRLALSGIDVIVHCAASVHKSNHNVADSLSEFYQVNVGGTLSLAEQAAKAGVRRFVFISTIGVNGGETLTIPFTAEDAVSPHSPYSWTKYKAELGLRALSAKSGMEVVIIRPPLIYGYNAPGNFGLLVRLLQLGFPLPLGSLNNRRSFVALENLVDLTLRCISYPSAANQTFLVSDDEDISTTELLLRTGYAMGRPAHLFPMPPTLLKIGAYLIGRPAFAKSLICSLQVDISKTRNLLDWKPIVSVDEGLQRAVGGGL